jgi:hypothetical protein
VTAFVAPWTAVELRKRQERGPALELPSTPTLSYPNVVALAGNLGPRLATGAGAASPPAESARPPSTAALANAPAVVTDLEALSDDELEARLLASLERAR